MSEAIQRLTAALSDRYTIERELGAGGMATVYLAHDVRHDRKVALKVLRPELSAILGGERFLHEIKTTANLQHPHILSLFDSGEADGLVFYVMPYVEGESLRDRLNREKQLPVDEAVRIAREVADALHYAHQHGIVHRDIKPENILLHGGHAQVADFGIALAASRSDGGTRMTETGMSLGTPQYMAPEQAMGERDISPRADLYALGCVLYEMLAGEPPFTGPTAQAIIARIMTEPPRRLTLQRHTIPPHVEDAVCTALEKLPADRFGSAAEFAAALAGDAPLHRRTDARGAGQGASVRRSVGASAIPWALIAIAAAAAGYLARRAPAPTPSRLSIVLPPGQRVSPQPFPLLAVSPDGRTVALVVEQAGPARLFLRRLDDPQLREVAGSEGACCPAFSPDGRLLFFGAANGAAMSVPVSGGSPSVVRAPAGILSYLPGEPVLVTTANGALARVRGDGSLDTITTGDVGAPVLATDLLPDGRILAVVGFGGPLVAIAPDGRRDTLVTGVVMAGYYADGYLAWIEQSGVLSAARLDRRKRRLAGPPVQLEDGIRVVPGGVPALHVSRGGTLAFVTAQPSELVAVDRTGRARLLTTERRRFHCPSVSPDGHRIAVDVTDASSRDVWLLDRRDSSFTRLSFEPGGHDPMWTRDGRTVVFATNANSISGIARRAADGSGSADSIYQGVVQTSAHAWGEPGSLLVVRLGASGDVLSVPLDGSAREPVPLLATRANEGYPATSPDGRWLAYVSDESGRPEVYLRSFPALERRIIVSQNGGTEPVWSHSGRELFYRGADNRLVVATIESGAAPRVSARRSLFPVTDFENASPHANYSVLPGDQEFVMVRQGRASELVVLQHWVELVRRREADSR